MKKIFSLIILLTLSAGVFAQESKIPVIKEITTIEQEDSDTYLELFSMEKDGQLQYYLNVGNLGIGDEIIQVNFDPLFKLFIPLGGTLAEAMETLGQMQDLFKQPKGTSIEMDCCFSPTFPTDKLEKAKVTYRKPLLSRMLEFSLERDGYIRATTVSKSDLSAVVSGAKFYRKIHPKEP